MQVVVDTEYRVDDLAQLEHASGVACVQQLLAPTRSLKYRHTHIRSRKLMRRCLTSLVGASLSSISCNADGREDELETLLGRRRARR